jgi:organic hydroperoxide reductase OsmC/OhrA
MTFTTTLVWTGATTPSRDPATFSRHLDVSFGATTLPMSAAPDYYGDRERANPEQLFVAALSSCHALTYLALAARAGVVIVSYADAAEGLLERVDGRMAMTRVTLRPHIVIARDADLQRAHDLVAKAHSGCFISNSVTAMVDIEPVIERTYDHVDSDQIEGYIHPPVVGADARGH